MSVPTAPTDGHTSAVPAETTVDPITLEVIRSGLPAITNEMSLDLQRSSYNMMIYEVGDFSMRSARRRRVADCPEHGRGVALRGGHGRRHP